MEEIRIWETQFRQLFTDVKKTTEEYFESAVSGRSDEYKAAKFEVQRKNAYALEKFTMSVNCKELEKRVILYELQERNRNNKSEIYQAGESLGQVVNFEKKIDSELKAYKSYVFNKALFINIHHRLKIECNPVVVQGY